MPVWELVRAIKEGRPEVLRDALAAGFSPNTACEYTGMTALLGACEANDLQAVELLLQAGANPNQQHHDGYDAYHSTRSRAVREVLLRAGFSRLLDGPTTGHGLYARRTFAPHPHAGAWRHVLDGATVCVEYCRSRFPPPGGDVIVRLAGGARQIAPGDHVTLPAAVGPIEVAVELADFVGELQVRLWDEATIASNPGARTFWLPAWSAE